VLLLLIQTGEQQWKLSFLPSCPTTLGICCLGQLELMWLPASGYSSTSFMLMGVLSATKLVGYFVDLLSGLVLTSQKLSVQLLSQPQFGQFCLLLFLALGRSISSMSTTLFFRDICQRRFTVLSLMDLKILLIPITCVGLIALFGLKQAPRAWFSRFASHLLQLGFTEAKSDTSLFVYHHGADVAYLLLYVDDIVLTASSPALLRQIIGALQQEFSMKDLGILHHFLGMHVQHLGSNLFLSQQQYMIEILERAGMADCKSCLTPVDLNPKLSAEGPPLSSTGATDFRSLAGALQWLTFTRPDISYAVQQVCLHMHDPRETHLAALKRILRYVRGTLHMGLLIRPSTPADCAGCPDTRRSTSGYALFLGDNLVSWSSKRQNTVSRSSAEAEYRVANAVAEATWLRQLLSELHTPLRKTTLVYCDNISSVYMSANHVQHQRTKHIEIDLHFVRERVALGDVRVLHVPTTSQFADIFNKGLPSSVFTEFRSSLNVRCSDDSTAGGC